MIIQQALKSGKPFKRPDFDMFYNEIYQDEDFNIVYMELRNTITRPIETRELTLEDILAEDWEIENEI